MMTCRQICKLTARWKFMPYIFWETIVRTNFRPFLTLKLYQWYLFMCYNFHFNSLILCHNFHYTKRSIQVWSSLNLMRQLTKKWKNSLTFKAKCCPPDRWFYYKLLKLFRTITVSKVFIVNMWFLVFLSWPNIWTWKISTCHKQTNSAIKVSPLVKVNVILK